MSALTPQQIVAELDRHIVGQADAKRAVAIALRNRWRRSQVEAGLREEITPKNILMIGPTGVGYVGRDVDTIIRDLADLAVKQTRQAEAAKFRARAQDAAEDRVLDILIPMPHTPASVVESTDSVARQNFRKKLREGQLDEREIELDLSLPQPQLEIMGPAGMEDMAEQLRGMFGQLGQGKKQTRKLKIRDALKLLADEEAAKLVNEDEIKIQALQMLEQNGIVFIDEIDKVTSRAEGSSSGEVSRQGVQRDLLPLVEGTTVSTKYGMVKTDHILFIASGAFHLSKPSDLIPELQGRFPIRVELQSLSVQDFVAILTQTTASLVKQYQALLATEQVELVFETDGIERLAQIAFEVNERTENIGARRLATVMERLLDDVSFEAERLASQTVRIDAAYVDARLNALSRDEDLSRFIL